MVLHVLETFFRHPVVHLLPLVLLLVFGLISALDTTKTYRSMGILNAMSGTLLSELTGDTSGFGYESSANVTSRNINQLLGTRAFLDDVVANAGLTGAVESGLLTSDEIRGSITSWAQGDNLIAVAATTPRPEHSQALAAATMDTFVEHVVGTDIADALLKVDIYEGLRDDALAGYNTAFADLTSYLETHPAGDEDDRPVGQRLDIAKLEDAVNRADDEYNAAVANVDEATVAAGVARTVVERQLRVIDEPEVPVSPLAGLRKMAFTVGVFGVLGALLSLGIVVIAAMLDRTIRTPGDISSRFGVEVLAVVPSARR